MLSTARDPEQRQKNAQQEEGGGGAALLSSGQEAYMKTGEVIRRYRKQKNLTQEEMAARLGVTAPAVNKWENGNSLPDIALLAPIARLLGASLEELLSMWRHLPCHLQAPLRHNAGGVFNHRFYFDSMKPPGTPCSAPSCYRPP